MIYRDITNFFYNKEKHGFHLVENSQLPVMTAFSTFLLVLSFIIYQRQSISAFVHLNDLSYKIAMIQIIAILMCWFVTVVYESGQGHHTKVVRKGLRLGMVLFILSEVMLFFSFFWAFFHISISPAQALGSIWPPTSIQDLGTWGLPLVNTLLLLSSGLTLTVAHRAIIQGNSEHYTKVAEISLAATIVLGLTFIYCQFVEYRLGVMFNWSETVYGGSFFVTTGFHGLHVTIGLIFLIFCLFRSWITTAIIRNLYDGYLKQTFIYLSTYSFRKEQHIGFEAAAWYWHFVDVVWIFLFVTIYWWGS